MSQDYDRILSDVKDINKKYKQFQSKTAFKGLSHEEFKDKMRDDHKQLFDTQNFIFNRSVDGTMDPTVFSYMISKAKDVKRNKISNHDASKDVGQKLVDTFIKPNLKK
jgi:hypothetical protein